MEICKWLYVECKAFRDKNIDANIITTLIGKKTLKKYTEAWLISTTEFGKEAKGVKKELEDEKHIDFTFYTPTKLIEALQNSNTICSHEIAKNKIIGLIKDINKLGNTMFLITEYGYFWLFEYLEGGIPVDTFVTYANNGDLVKDVTLLDNLSKTDSSFNTCSFKKNLEIIGLNSDILSVSSDNNFKLSESYINRLNDTGVKFTHPHKDELTLSDIFVYQDLQDIEDEKQTRINSEKLLLLSDYSKCIVFGEEVSGKTSLVSTLQKEFNRDGLLPIYIDAKSIKSSDIEKFKSVVFNNFKKQYHEINDSVIKNILDSKNEKIVILIDCFESLGIKKQEYKSKFLEMLSANFVNVLIFADESSEMEIMTKEELKSQLIDFKFYRIKEYGYKLRDKMIEKWLTIGNEETITDNHLLERKDEVFKMIETVIGNKFIPTYPLYIITLLQQIEAGSSNNLGGSAYAEFYNYLINQAMGTTKIQSDELDFYHTYISYIAYNYFIQARNELELSEIDKLHEKYADEYHKKPFNQVYNNLIDAKLLKEDNGFYRFGHNYIYYFYVAKYLSDNMEKRQKKEEINQQIDMLIKRLYRTEFANIVIFLIHHSKSRAEMIIDRIMEEAKEIFSEIAPSTLSKEELIKINELVTEEINLVIEDKSPHAHRQESLELKDEIDNNGSNNQENDSMPKYNEDIKELDIFGKINLSSKLMEILGQITKNYYGSLPKIEKVSILSELSNLGLRNLNLFLTQFSEYSELLEKNIREKVEKKNLNSDADIEKITKRIIFSFAEFIAIHFIKKTSSNMASKNLFESLDELPTNTEAMKLINIATKLDFSGGLNKEKVLALNHEFSHNRIAKELLKLLIVDHLYKFNVEYKKRQEICDKLNISVQAQKNILIDKSKK